MEQPTYVDYLQNLLKQHNITYLTQQEFTKNKIKLVKDFIRGPLETNLQQPLFGDLVTRYSRQMLLKEIGYEGQLKLCKSKVALIGSGGIGCPLGLYLAGAGIGTLGLFDSDVVDMTNLHRQVGHSTPSIGKLKTESLKQTLSNLNPHICINEHPFITKETLHFLDDYDLVIDGSDNPLCRYLVNDYVMSKNKKLLSGACVGWEGQVTCYGQNSACYRCIWGNDQISMGGCATLGVVGMLPGIVGIILAVECLKTIIGGSSSLEGHLLTYQAKTCTFRKMKLRNKKEDCEACGNKKMSIAQYDYSKYGACSSTTSQLPEVPTVPWQQMITIINSSKYHRIIDVRPQSHFNIINIKNSINIPYEKLIHLKQEQLQQILESKDKPIFVSCKMGILSRRATDFLLKNGYTQSKNIEGGISSYGKQFDSNIVNL